MTSTSNPKLVDEGKAKPMYVLPPIPQHTLILLPPVPSPPSSEHQLPVPKNPQSDEHFVGIYGRFLRGTQI
ncbi:hypothetical protein JAAARDRAFT_69088 [Jaapia argillacea MUCL 33604]|uniref:Uncharacterized protein n=1 Tax=Jaapia argillacea MUCL 33604 TaxID=933084 RepID=A0A067Q7P9_9AGAM|nr:hypothetical protein JAAARDRAFT_69088 [Jaapia argillacea MUCL 33604]